VAVNSADTVVHVTALTGWRGFAAAAAMLHGLFDWLDSQPRWLRHQKSGRNYDHADEKQWSEHSVHSR